MTLRRFAKIAAYRTAQAAGIGERLAGSDWRQRRLGVLCYHGFSFDQEHRWRPGLYVRPETFARRLAQLRNGGYEILPFAEAVRRLYEGALPPRTVTMTTDDGFVDFGALAAPALAAAEVPMTLYLTTHYVGVRVPLFNLMAPYLLWLGRDRSLALKEFTGRDETVSLQGEPAQDHVAQLLLDACGSSPWGYEERTAVLGRLANSLKVDFARLLELRVLQIMTPEEIRGLDRRWIDVQLHTHRHRMPLESELLTREVLDNRSVITKILPGRASPSHFCYPSGVFHPDSPRVLASAGVETAVTCEAGLASPDTDPWLIPRYLDGEAVTDLEFEGMVSGLHQRLGGAKG